MLRYLDLALFSALLFSSCLAESPPIFQGPKLFITVAGGQVLGKYPFLSQAKRALKNFPDGATTPLRMIVEVNNGRVNQDPSYVGGENQAGGLQFGFNVWWNSWTDIEQMMTIAQASLGDTKGRFIVVANGKIKGDFTSLRKAKAALNAFPSGASTPERMVIEVVNGKVLNDPRRIAGHSQELGVATGFNKFWSGWDSIDEMLWVAQDYLDRPKGDVKGIFIVVVGLKVIGKYTLLSQAQAKLKIYPQGAKSPSRIIFEVKNGNILDDPRTISGRNQMPGNNAGFNSYWTGWDEVDEFLYAAEKYLNRPVGDVSGDFLVVVGQNVLGRFKKLSLAQAVLNRYPKASKTPVRCILEIKNGKVDNDPRYIAGRYQVDGIDAGFNFHWPGWDAIDKMISVGEGYLMSLQNPKGTFLVVAGDTVLGEYNNLNSAKNALKSYPSGARKPSRMVIEVRNGKVLYDPRLVAGQNQEAGIVNGFNRYWTGWPDIDNMLNVGQKYLDGKNNPFKGIVYIVVVNVKVVGYYPVLRVAQSVLSGYPRNTISRCIFEANNGLLNPDISIIGGQQQGINVPGLFNSYWKSMADIRRMLIIAHIYILNIYPVVSPLPTWIPPTPSPRPSKSSSPRPSRSSSPIPSASPSPSCKRGTFLVCVGNSVVGEYGSLCDAKRELNKYPPGIKTPSRCIFEVKNGKIEPDPRIVGGEKQVDGLSAGYNRWWWDWHDINRMLSYCSVYWRKKNGRPILKPSPLPSVVVTTCRVKDACSRRIVNVLKGTIWTNSCRKKYSVSNRCVLTLIAAPSPSPRPRITHYFLVIQDNGGGTNRGKSYRVVGKYKTWQAAKSRLRSYGSRQGTSRMVAEVKGGRVQPDPHKIAGQNQGGGPGAGWMKFWWDWWDIRNMIRTGQNWINSRPTAGFNG